MVLDETENPATLRFCDYLHGRKAEMAATGDAERITGSMSGGISPLGQGGRIRTFLDKTAHG